MEPEHVSTTLLISLSDYWMHKKNDFFFFFDEKKKLIGYALNMHYIVTFRNRVFA